MYHKGYFSGGSNTDIKLKTCKDKIIIPSKIKKLRIALVPYISPSSKNGWNRGNN